MSPYRGDPLLGSSLCRMPRAAHPPAHPTALQTPPCPPARRPHTTLSSGSIHPSRAAPRWDLGFVWDPWVTRSWGASSVCFSHTSLPAGRRSSKGNYRLTLLPGRGSQQI